MVKLKTLDDVYELLDRQGADKHLLRHIEMVQEAAEILIHKYRQLKLSVDENFIVFGVCIHDIGKIKYSQELFAVGDRHEKEGQRLLLTLGVDPKLARCCISHGKWKEMNCSLEELTIALADKLWKGKRVQELELEIINRITMLLNDEKWKLFLEMDTTFERIASSGDDRLNRSRII